MLAEDPLAQATIDAFARKEMLEARVLLGAGVMLGFAFATLNWSRWLAPLTAGLAVVLAAGVLEWLKAWRRYRALFGELSARNELPLAIRVRPRGYFRGHGLSPDVEVIGGGDPILALLRRLPVAILSGIAFGLVLLRLLVLNQ